jgi:hypothetical protein
MVVNASARGARSEIDRDRDRLIIMIAQSRALHAHARHEPGPPGVREAAQC